MRSLEVLLQSRAQVAPGTNLNNVLRKLQSIGGANHDFLRDIECLWDERNKLQRSEQNRDADSDAVSLLIRTESALNLYA